MQVGEKEIWTILPAILDQALHNYVIYGYEEVGADVTVGETPGYICDELNHLTTNSVTYNNGGGTLYQESSSYETFTDRMNTKAII